MSGRHERELTAEELEGILADASQGRFVEAVVGTFAAFGVDLLDQDGPQIRPGDYAIPRAQWDAICSALIASEPRNVEGLASAANRALDWVNLGPSGYEEEG